MEIDYRKPLELQAILIDKIPLSNNSIGVCTVPFRSRIMWSSIVCVEDFVRTWLLPPDNTYYNTPKVNIVTATMVYTIVGDYNEVADAWTDYRVWASNKSMFNYN